MLRLSVPVFKRPSSSLPACSSEIPSTSAISPQRRSSADMYNCRSLKLCPESPSRKRSSNLRDRYDISGFDFGSYSRASRDQLPRPFPGSFAQNLFHSLDRGEIRWLAHSDVRGFSDGNADGHFALREKDHEELQVGSGNSLLFRSTNVCRNAVRRIDDEVCRIEF